MNTHLILRTVSKLLIPLIVIFGLYVQFHGDFGPGGGFQAGVIVAAGVILYALIFGIEACKIAVPPSWIRIGMTLGVLLYTGTGVATWVMGGSFLDYDVLAYNPHHPAGQHLGILLVELGVLFTVATVMVAVFYAFASRTPDLKDGDW
jgi:multicomponent Na+:H+ antiporter subunit B